MPRRVITHPDHERQRALHISVWWIETFTVHGPGDVQGEPSILVDEFADFIVDCYALDGAGKRFYDSAFFSRPKGCDKSGLAAKLVLFEAFGPSRFAGWAVGGETYEFLGQVYTYRAGEAMGKTITVPYIRIMATEEGQTGNVFDTVYYNLTDEAAPLSAMRAYGCDPGLTRVMLPGGGEITPSTAGAASKDGGKETFVVFDESHLYITPMLRQMYSTVTRNLRKRKKIAGTWFIETTTMYSPGQESIAEQTYQLADSLEENKLALAESGRRKFKNLRSNLLFDHRWGAIEDLSDEAQLIIAIEEAYGEAMLWNSIEGIIDGIFDPREAEVDSRRYFLNALTEGLNAWVTLPLLEKIIALGQVVDFIAPAARKVATGPREKITLGFDGSKNDDATALVACRIADRHLFPLLIEEVPDGPEAATWSVNREAFDAKVAWAFEHYEVVGFYGDPPHWQDYLDKWAREFGDQLLVHASGKHSIEWWTNRDIAMSLALERLHTSMQIGSMSFASGDEPIYKVFRRHFVNARRWPRRGGVVIGKDRKGSSRKMDAAVAGALAFEAASDYLAKPQPKPSTYVPIKVR